MKIYFTASQRGKDLYLNNYLLIATYLKELDQFLIEDDLFELSQEDFITKFKNKTEEACKRFHDNKIKYIQQADTCIFECTTQSSSMGLLVQKALDLGKPTIILHLKETPLYFFLGTNDDKLIVKSYNEKNLKRILKQSLAIAQERREKRFNFYLSTKLLEYIETLSKEDGSTKSKVMRDIILRDMRRKEKLSL